MRRNSMMSALSIAAALGAGVSFPDYGQHPQRYRGRHRLIDFTLDELEEQSVHRMMSNARLKRNREARRIQQIENARRAAEAAAIEQARPKSRQELRRIERKKAKRLREDRCFQKRERRQ